MPRSRACLLEETYIYLEESAYSLASIGTGAGTVAESPYRQTRSKPLLVTGSLAT